VTCTVVKTELRKNLKQKAPVAAETANTYPIPMSSSSPRGHSVKTAVIPIFAVIRMHGANDN